MSEVIQKLVQDFQTARWTEGERTAAEALVRAVSETTEILSRETLDAAFWAANFCKRVCKPVRNENGTQQSDRGAFLGFAQQIVAIRQRFRELPEGERRLGEGQVGIYAWAVYAVATESDDPVESRTHAELFRKIYEYRVRNGWHPETIDENALRRMDALLASNRREIENAELAAKAGDLGTCVKCYHEALTQEPLSAFDAERYGWKMVKRIWGNETRGRELRSLMSDFLRLSADAWSEDGESSQKIRHGFLVGLAKRLHALEKGAGGNRVAIPFDIASLYLQIAELNCGLLLKEDFVRRPITAEERANMERRAGRKVRLKEWPSAVETVIGVAAHCVKEHAFTPARLRPGERLLSFLKDHLTAGEWFGFHYSMWLKAVGRIEESTSHLLKMVESKKNEAWAWAYLGETYVNDPEKARACYCRALTCPVHDEDIATAMAKKTHRKFAGVLRVLGDTAAAQEEEALSQAENPLPGRRDDYLRYAQEARLLLLGDKKIRRFEGRFRRTEGKSFGFVQIDEGRRDGIFVPPPLAGKLADGALVKGIAVLKMDVKKGREGWTAEILDREA